MSGETQEKESTEKITAVEKVKEAKNSTIAQYTKDKIKKTEQEEVKVSTERSKIIERVTYKNGVVKSRLVGTLKKGKVIFNAGMEKQWLNPNKNALKK
jgi:hypothetical protein